MDLNPNEFSPIPGLAEAALGEGTGAKLHKLSVKDIQYVSWSFSNAIFSETQSHFRHKLFGMNKDKDKHPAAPAPEDD